MKERRATGAPLEISSAGSRGRAVDSGHHDFNVTAGVPTRQMRRAEELSGCDRAVLLTAIYADLFDYPLTADEVYDRLIGRGFGRRDLAASLDRLRERYLSLRDGFTFVQSRGHLVGLRRARRRRSEELWSGALRYAQWLACVPFVRMVAVSGSLAVNNSNGTSDVDVFCVTDARRLWAARLFIVPLSKLTRLLPSIFPLYLCPNYVVSMEALDVRDRNLFTAHEVLQAVPLYGGDVYRKFVQRNRWACRMLPNLRWEAVQKDQLDTAKPAATRLIERILGGRAGDVLNRFVYRSFTAFYRWRARRNGWDWNRLSTAYQLERYTVPEGGYASVIADLFRERTRDITKGAISASELNLLFPDGQHEDPACYDWKALFRKEYSSGVTEAA